MNKKEWKEFLKHKPLYLDGATGTNLQAAGMPLGVCPELWVMENPQVLLDLQRAYVEAGTNILYAPTFTGNRIKLAEYGLADRLKEINQNLVQLSREAADGKALVAGDISMTGQQLYPIGDMEFEELVDIYKEQILALSEAGADLLVIETMMSLQESRAALIAAKEVCDLPVMVSLTFEASGRTLFGTDAATAAVVLESLGADAIGINCSTGPEQMVEQIRKMCERTTIPVFAKPNAGLPKLVDGKTVFDMGPEAFATSSLQLIHAGAQMVGGCCGTTPEHIRQLKKTAGNYVFEFPERTPGRFLASERKTIEIRLDGPFQVVGERINPTGKKKLQEELRAGSLDLVMEMAEEQDEQGAAILDVNMGLNGIDEKEMMLEAISEIASVTDCPLCIDSSHVEVIEAALRAYPGRALINSISLESAKFTQLLPLARKYGAMFILLPLSDAGLPETIEEKHQIIHTIMDEAIRIGMKKEDIIVDGLVATIGANKMAAQECFTTIAYCKEELGLATICGLSNISFGLPERIYVNSAFLTVAISKGLTMAIANPSQELLMNAAYASDLLMNKADADIRYINRMRKEQVTVSAPVVKLSETGESQTLQELREKVSQSVLNGNKNGILTEVDRLLAAGKEAGAIINEDLIPAISQVGELFDKQVYFLPQLISSATAMETAIAYLEPMIEKDSQQQPKASIVIATVEGDIHDIGKNLVALMLRNFGYRVIDLGKDIEASRIVDCAVAEGAQIIALSALMTTTMMKMKDVVALAKEKGCTAKIIIGGAAATPSFSDEIGADGFSSDAAECVRLVDRLLS